MGTTPTVASRHPRSDPPTVASSRSLADALFTATQQRLLGLLFGQSNRSFFVTELIELADVGRGAVQRELSRLERSGLVITERRGTQKHYRANSEAPIFEELSSIMRKTVGVGEQVGAALQPLATQISLALIYGSVAKQSDSADSDIDLLVVSDDLTLEDLYSCLADVEKQLGRRISPALYTASEFNKRRTDDNVFLKRVLEGPISLLTGELHVA